MRNCRLYVERRANEGYGWFYWGSYKERAHARQAATDVCSSFDLEDRLWKIEDGGISIFRPEIKRNK